ncbi:MAG: UPF0280 family protein [Desulfovibrionales bacterium]|nr:MAG: UPF0280 family protein [Desulfovibrionales bacterium]
MNQHTSPWRTYRRRTLPGTDEVGFQVVVEQTDLWVVAQRDVRREVLQAVNTCRGLLQTHISRQPEFATSLVPISVSSRAAGIVQDMARAARICGVGPMAAVAGAMAQWVVTWMDEHCPEVGSTLLVENGGDLFLRSARERIIGLLAFPEGDAGLGLRIGVNDFPCSFCSSSATIGHSLSFGQADLMAARSQSAALADAAATALANLLRTPKDMPLVMERAAALAQYGLDGVFAQCGEQVGVWGDMDLVCLES